MSSQPFDETDINEFLGEMKVELIDDADTIARYYDGISEEWVDISFRGLRTIPQHALQAWMKHWVKSNPGGSNSHRQVCKRDDIHCLSLVSEFKDHPDIWDELYVYRLDANNFAVLLIRCIRFPGKPITSSIEEWLREENKREEEARRKTEDERRAAAVQARRKSSRQCIMCGQRLNFVEKLLRTTRHSGCTSFKE